MRLIGEGLKRLGRESARASSILRRLSELEVRSLYMGKLSICGYEGVI